MERLRALALSCILGWSGPAVAAEAVGELSAEVWAASRSGEELLQVAVLQEAVDRWAAQPERYLVIQHRGGESGTLWAAQVEDWLVALGIPADAVETRPGNVPADRLRLAVSY